MSCGRPRIKSHAVAEITVLALARAIGTGSPEPSHICWALREAKLKRLKRSSPPADTSSKNAMTEEAAVASHALRQATAVPPRTDDAAVQQPEHDPAYVAPVNASRIAGKVVGDIAAEVAAMAAAVGNAVSAAAARARQTPPDRVTPRIGRRRPQIPLVWTSKHSVASSPTASTRPYAPSSRCFSRTR